MATTSPSSKVTIVWNRIGKQLDQANPFAGSWLRNEEKTFAGSPSDFAIRPAGPDGMHYEDAAGGVFAAQYDGKDYSVMTNPSSTVSITRIDGSTLKETVKSDGITEVCILAVSYNGRELNETCDSSSGRHSEVVYKKTVE